MQACCAKDWAVGWGWGGLGSGKAPHGARPGRPRWGGWGQAYPYLRTPIKIHQKKIAKVRVFVSKIGGSAYTPIKKQNR